jgi:hypothetical protein
MLRNVTLSAEQALIDRARQKAARQNRTLNSAFREWLAQYSAEGDVGEGYRGMMERLGYVRPGRKFTRDEMNER